MNPGKDWPQTTLALPGSLLSSYPPEISAPLQIFSTLSDAPAASEFVSGKKEHLSKLELGSCHLGANSRWENLLHGIKLKVRQPRAQGEVPRKEEE